jgi:peptidoglycan L-alanyl-D-glutamate endopeptidase CwlK
MSLSSIVGGIANHGVELAVISGVASLAIAMLLFYPDFSQSLRLRATAVLGRSLRALSKSGHGMWRRLHRVAAPESWLNALIRSRGHWPVLALVGILALPAAAILFLDGEVGVASFGRSATYETNPEGTVAALLRGEHLMPPAALPPATFSTREVELVRPRLVYASRAWELLDDAFAQRLLRVYQLMKERHGYEMVLIEGYRSPERQNELAALGSHVTSAAAFQSYHQYGLAADSAFLKEGLLVISEKDPWAMQGYRLFGELAAEHGLTWGGHWTLRDFGHVEWRRRKTS